MNSQMARAPGLACNADSAEIGPMENSPPPHQTEGLPVRGKPVAGGVVGDVLRRVWRAFLSVLGGLLILLGIPIGIATPLIPIGLPIIITGVVLLGRNSDFGRHLMEKTLARWPKLERFAPNWLMRLVFGRDKYDLTHPAEADAAAAREKAQDTA